MERVASSENELEARAALELIPRQVLTLGNRSSIYEPIAAAKFSPDARYVAIGGDDRMAHVYEARTGKELHRFPHPDRVDDVEFSPDGKYLATASLDTGRVFELATEKGVSRWDPGEAVFRVSFSPDGRHVVSACGWSLGSSMP